MLVVHLLTEGKLNMATTTKKTKKQSEKILDVVSALKPQTVIEEIGTLQNTLQGTLAGLSAQISIKLEQMRNVEDAIVLKQSELNDLYGIEAEALSLEEMNKQCLIRQTQWEDDNEERSKRWQREEEEHSYDISQKKKRSQEEYNIEITTRRRSEVIRQEDLEKQWKTREEAISTQEKEFLNLQTQVAGFDDRLKADVSKAEAIAVNRVKKDYEHEILILKKDIDSERVLNATKVSALDDTINNLQMQIVDLHKQLAQSRTDAKEITSAALQSASGRQAMEALQRVTDGQPSTNKK
jgi:actin-related protein